MKSDCSDEFGASFHFYYNTELSEETAPDFMIFNYNTTLYNYQPQIEKKPAAALKTAYLTNYPFSNSAFHTKRESVNVQIAQSFWFCELFYQSRATEKKNRSGACAPLRFTFWFTFGFTFGFTLGLRRSKM